MLKISFCSFFNDKFIFWFFCQKKSIYP